MTAAYILAIAVGVLITSFAMAMQNNKILVPLALGNTHKQDQAQVMTSVYILNEFNFVSFLIFKIEKTRSVYIYVHTRCGIVLYR